MRLRTRHELASTLDSNFKEHSSPQFAAAKESHGYKSPQTYKNVVMRRSLEWVGRA